MSTEASLYVDFLGTWRLIPESCDYEQGEAPRAGTYVIKERGGALVFDIDWTDAEGTTHSASFSGVPDGQPRPFAGGDLADALSVTAVSDRELCSSALWRGEELMVAQRQLDETKTAMRVVQLVRFRNGTEATNVAIYKRQLAPTGER